MQLTDLHYVVGNASSAESLKTIGRILDEERPNLVVITGDVVTAKPMAQGWDEVLAPIIARGLPYAVVLGNHDQEQGWSRREVIEYAAHKPLSLTKRGPKKLTGEGNYVVKVGGTRLLMLDSGDYSTIGKYAWIAPDQVRWASRQLRKGKGPAFAFFHIPLQEFGLLAAENRIGTRGENECPGALNGGLFAAFFASGRVGGVFVGHDHDDDYIGQLHGIWLGFGRFSGGDTIYNNIGKGARVIVLRRGEREFDTWIRTAEGKIEHKQ